MDVIVKVSRVQRWCCRRSEIIRSGGSGRGMSPSVPIEREVDFDLFLHDSFHDFICLSSDGTIGDIKRFNLRFEQGLDMIWGLQVLDWYR